jgi:hypothetical protein
MNLALPATRTFAYLCGGSLAVVLVIAFTGEAVFGPEPHPVVRIVFLSIFFALLLVMVYSMTALMVRFVIGGNVAFWMRLGATLGSTATVETISELAPRARRIGDAIILVFWAIGTLGLAIAVPAMIIHHS